MLIDSWSAASERRPCEIQEACPDWWVMFFFRCGLRFLQGMYTWAVVRLLLCVFETSFDFLCWIFLHSFLSRTTSIISRMLLWIYWVWWRDLCTRQTARVRSRQSTRLNGPSWARCWKVNRQRLEIRLLKWVTLGQRVNGRAGPGWIIQRREEDW